jgi:hypothetical protein
MINGTNPGPFNNAGTLLRSTSTGIATIGVVLNNSDTVGVNSGTLRLTTDGANTGPFGVLADAGCHSRTRVRNPNL